MLLPDVLSCVRSLRFLLGSLRLEAFASFKLIRLRGTPPSSSAPTAAGKGMLTGCCVFSSCYGCYGEESHPLSLILRLRHVPLHISFQAGHRKKSAINLPGPEVQGTLLAQGQALEGLPRAVRRLALRGAFWSRT